MTTQTDIIIKTRAVDSRRTDSRKFKTLAGARKRAHHVVGEHPANNGTDFVVSDDGIATLRFVGCTFEELFPGAPKHDHIVVDGDEDEANAAPMDEDEPEEVGETSDDDSLDEDEDEAPRGMASTLNRYKPGYDPCVAYSGAKSLNNGDDLAHLLEGATPEQVATIAERALDLPAGSLVLRYASLNPGQVRMNSGNRIRAAVKRGDVTIDDVKRAAAGIHTPGTVA